MCEVVSYEVCEFMKPARRCKLRSHERDLKHLMKIVPQEINVVKYNPVEHVPGCCKRSRRTGEHEPAKCCYAEASLLREYGGVRTTPGGPIQEFGTNMIIYLYIILSHFLAEMVKIFINHHHLILISQK